MTYTIDGYTYAYDVSQRYSPIYKRAVSQLTFAIPGGGCKFWIQTRGRGCTFCGFPGLTRKLTLGDGNDDNYEGWRLSSDIFEKMYQTAMANSEPAEKLAVFNGGSFFVDSELPPDFRTALLEDAASRPGVRQIMVKSRPEYISADALDEAEPVLAAEKHFMVGIGVESADDRVRNKLLAKGMKRAEIERAIRLMKERSIQVFAYAFLKAPGLSERDALQDARDTLAFLTDLGVDEIALSCAFVPPGTPLEAKYHAGAFRPPWLWTVRQIIEDAEAQGWPLSVGGFDDNPPPIAIARNCGRCDTLVLDCIDQFRTSGHIAPAPSCGCRQAWSQDVLERRHPMPN